MPPYKSSLQPLIDAYLSEMDYQIRLEEEISPEIMEIIANNKPLTTEAADFSYKYEHSLIKQITISTIIRQQYCPTYEQYLTGNKTIGLNKISKGETK